MKLKRFERKMSIVEAFIGSVWTVMSKWLHI